MVPQDTPAEKIFFIRLEACRQERPRRESRPLAENFQYPN